MDQSKYIDQNTGYNTGNTLLPVSVLALSHFITSSHSANKLTYHVEGKTSHQVIFLMLCAILSCNSKFRFIEGNSGKNGLSLV